MFFNTTCKAGAGTMPSITKEKIGFERLTNLLKVTQLMLDKDWA